MISLTLAAALFLLIHLGVSGTVVRDRVVGAIGLNRYMLAFSLASVAAMAWLVSSYATAGYVPLWDTPNLWRYVSLVLMLPAFLLVVVGLTTPNPTAAGQEARVADEPRGIVRITRHPFLVGVAIWAVTHLVSNGDLASVLFFASLAGVSIAGTVSIDAKRRRALGAGAWDAFASRTSIVPFAAILAGRNTLNLAELGWWRPLAGVAAYALFLGGHRHIIGVSPWPVM